MSRCYQYSSESPQSVPPLRKRKYTLKRGIVNTQARTCVVSFRSSKWTLTNCWVRGSYHEGFTSQAFVMTGLFREVNFIQKLTSSQESFCVVFDNWKRLVFRWSLANCQQKAMSLRKRFHLRVVKVSLYLIVIKLLKSMFILHIWRSRFQSSYWTGQGKKETWNE